MTVDDLSKFLGIEPYAIIYDLMELEIFRKRNDVLSTDERLIAENHYRINPLEIDRYLEQCPGNAER